VTMIYVTDRKGVEHALNATTGNSVMQTIREGGLDDLLALCGGNCSCATCHVHVDGAFIKKLQPITSDESDLLAGSVYRADNSRLSCQLRITSDLDGLRLTIAPLD
jgi:2Fe-2S ferredoxin